MQNNWHRFWIVIFSTKRDRNLHLENPCLGETEKCNKSWRQCSPSYTLNSCSGWWGSAAQTHHFVCASRGKCKIATGLPREFLCRTIFNFCRRSYVSIGISVCDSEIRCCVKKVHRHTWAVLRGGRSGYSFIISSIKIPYVLPFSNAKLNKVARKIVKGHWQSKWRSLHRWRTGLLHSKDSLLDCETDIRICGHRYFHDHLNFQNNSCAWENKARGDSVHN